MHDLLGAELGECPLDQRPLGDRSLDIVRFGCGVRLSRRPVA